MKIKWKRFQRKGSTVWFAVAGPFVLAVNNSFAMGNHVGWSIEFRDDWFRRYSVPSGLYMRDAAFVSGSEEDLERAKARAEQVFGWMISEVVDPEVCTMNRVPPKYTKEYYT